MISPKRRKPAGLSLAQFKATLAERAPPPALAPTLAALWYAANGNWERAHDASQEQDDADGAWVHAYLHRLEGDEENARYWYGRAGRPVSSAKAAQEWEEIAKALMKR